MRTQFNRLPAAAAALSAALLLAGCASPSAERALIAQHALVGLSKQDLLSCAGVPERRAEADGREFFTYTQSRIVSYPGTAFGGWYGGPWYPGYRYGWAGGFPSRDEIRSYACDATFTLRDGVVERIVYGGSAGGGNLSECYAIVHNCLPAGPS